MEIEMSEKRTIGLINDSFPPLIDGVSNAVLNYAREIKAHYGEPVVVTPKFPGADDSAYDFPVLRYNSIDITKQFNVVAGIPFTHAQARKLCGYNVDLLHCHCPAASIVLSRELRNVLNAPLIMTYHSKYDIDIRKAVRGKRIQDRLISLVLENISACDEVWTVSRGAGEHLRSLGFEGDYVVMENGVDIPHERVSEKEIAKAVSKYDIPEGIPVFIFTGRMMWYKGIRIIADALAGLKNRGMDFRMIFVGAGTDYEDIQYYIWKCGIRDKCIFTGSIRSRDRLRALNCRANLQLFPSTFDTNGLVVREAAACSLPSILIEGSCAAEGVTDGCNGYLIEENAEALAAKIEAICGNLAAARQVGENAGNEIYFSWEDSVRKATERYEVVIDKYRRGEYPKRNTPADIVLDELGRRMSLSVDDIINNYNI